MVERPDAETRVSVTTPLPLGAAVPEWYPALLDSVSGRIVGGHRRAVAAANTELIVTYWAIGRDILDRQAEQGWGSTVIARLSSDLKQRFPYARGYSPHELKYLRALAEASPSPGFVQAPLARMTAAPTAVSSSARVDGSQELRECSSASRANCDRVIPRSCATRRATSCNASGIRKDTCGECFPGAPRAGRPAPIRAGVTPASSRIRARTSSVRARPEGSTTSSSSASGPWASVYFFLSVIVDLSSPFERHHVDHEQAVGLLHGDDLEQQPAVAATLPPQRTIALVGHHGDGLVLVHHVQRVGAPDPVLSRRAGEPNFHSCTVSDTKQECKVPKMLIWCSSPAPRLTSKLCSAALHESDCKTVARAPLSPTPAGAPFGPPGRHPDVTRHGQRHTTSPRERRPQRSRPSKSLRPSSDQSRGRMNQIHQDQETRMVNQPSDTQRDADARRFRTPTIRMNPRRLIGLAAGFASAMLWFWRRSRADSAQRSGPPHSSTAATRGTAQNFSHLDTWATDSPTDAEIDRYFIEAERDIRWSLIGVLSGGAVLAAVTWLVATKDASDFSAAAIADRFANLRAAFDVNGVSTSILVAVLGLVALVASLNVAIAAIGRGAEGRSSQDRVRTRVWPRAAGATAFLIGTLSVGTAALQVAAWPHDQAVATSLIVVVALATAFLSATTTLGGRSRVDEARTRALNDREREHIKKRLQHLRSDDKATHAAPPPRATKLTTRLKRTALPSLTVALIGVTALAILALIYGHSGAGQVASGLVVMLAALFLAVSYVHYNTFIRWTSGTARRAIPLFWRVRMLRGLVIAGALVLIALAVATLTDRGPFLAFACLLVTPALSWIALASTCPSKATTPHGCRQRFAHWLSAGTWDLVVESLRSKLKQLESDSERSANLHRPPGKMS